MCGLFSRSVLPPALIWAGTFAYYALTDRFALFWDAVFIFNLSYSGGSASFWSRFGSFFTPARHPFIFDSAMALWIGGLVAQVVLLVVLGLRRNLEALALVLLTFACYLAICLPQHFWPHYYYLLIPPLAVCLAAGLKLLVDLLETQLPARRVLLRGAALALFAASAVWLGYTEYRDYLSQPPFGITVKRYNSRDFWGRAQGENIRRVTDPDDTVFVYGNEAEVYYYAQRRCASPFYHDYRRERGLRQRRGPSRNHDAGVGGRAAPADSRGFRSGFVSALARFPSHVLR